MKRLTINRILIAAVLIYFSIAELGYTGSFWRGTQVFCALLYVAWLGYVEGVNLATQGREG